MGTSITAHMEILVNGEWIHYSLVNIPRNYNLFCVLAGVRCEFCYEKQMFPIKDVWNIGLAKTTSFHLYCDLVDVYAVSYITSTEFYELWDWLKDQDWCEIRFLEFFGLYLFGNSFRDFHKYKEDYPTGLEDFRMIFWFD